MCHKAQNQLRSTNLVDLVALKNDVQSNHCIPVIRIIVRRIFFMIIQVYKAHINCISVQNVNKVSQAKNKKKKTKDHMHTVQEINRSVLVQVLAMTLYASRTRT
jgi:hypothetical protein